eukprot:TRINITY_DN102045_c0_g1_i1.p1 TRINITY_DN102045_c0_g1~~TRINITY_DN102045_c0_g1_i1.p1  ORF type:complete len:400 (-),score=47.09 TRINITY_DN102045_c0_g1_i1:110-1309(-)
MDRLKSLVLRLPFCIGPQVTDEAVGTSETPSDECPAKSPCIDYYDAWVEKAPTTDSLPELSRQNSYSSTASASDEVQLQLPAFANMRAEVDACVQQAGNVAEWQPESFEFVKTLQNAARNQGRVELMKRLDTGAFVAVKRMPISWTANGHKDFLKVHLGETEMPWVDIGLVNFLHSKGVDWICEPMGVFQDQHSTFVVSALANNGDLFEWSASGPAPGLEREHFCQPIVSQIFAAIRYLHSLTIAHCDISLENLLLVHHEGEPLQVKVIDFGMAVVGTNEIVGSRGKPAYQAPEMHTQRSKFDPFLADSFAVGVVVFGIVAQDYPWMSTRPQACKFFEYLRAYGPRDYLIMRKSRRNEERPSLADLSSEALVELLEDLLAVNPSNRARMDSKRWRWLEH